MNKKLILSIILVSGLVQGHAQNKYFGDTHEPKTLLVEKIGTHRRYGYELGDLIKIRTKNHLFLCSNLWELNDSSIVVGQNRPTNLKDVESVYPQFYFPKKFGMYMFLSGITYFAVVSFDHLINKEIVFTKDVFIVPTALFGTGFICVSLSQNRCKIGDHWKLKVIGIRVR